MSLANGNHIVMWPDDVDLCAVTTITKVTERALSAAEAGRDASDYGFAHELQAANRVTL